MKCGLCGIPIEKNFLDDHAPLCAKCYIEEYNAWVQSVVVKIAAKKKADEATAKKAK